MINKQHTVLVVDDDSAHRTMLNTLINGWGYAVSEADDGSTAVDKIKETAFDLVLMDVRMVRVSGLEALEVIKSV
ncbi:MAG: response regulator, partial [Desulfobacterales bacterium]